MGPRGQRLIAVVAVAAIAATLAAAIIANRDENTPGSEVVDERLGVVTIPDEFAGRKLIAARESTRGRPLTLRVATTAGSEWLFSCSGVGQQYVLHQTLDHLNEHTALCAQAATIGRTMSFRFSKAHPGGGDRELQLWLTEVNETEIVTPDDAVLAAAVYSLPEPVANLAGSDILPVEESQNQEWTYVSGGESQLGSRSYTRHFDAIPGESILELATAGSTHPVFRLVVDGETVTTIPAEYHLGEVQLGDRLTGGSAHTVTLEIVGKVPADAQLAIVQRKLR